MQVSPNHVLGAGLSQCHAVTNGPDSSQFTYCHKKVVHCLITGLIFCEVTQFMLPGMSASDSPQAIFSSSLCTTPNIILLQQGKNFYLEPC